MKHSILNMRAGGIYLGEWIAASLSSEPLPWRKEGEGKVDECGHS